MRFSDLEVHFFKCDKRHEEDLDRYLCEQEEMMNQLHSMTQEEVEREKAVCKVALLGLESESGESVADVNISYIAIGVSVMAVFVNMDSFFFIDRMVDAVCGIIVVSALCFILSKFLYQRFSSKKRIRRQSFYYKLKLQCIDVLEKMKQKNV